MTKRNTKNDRTFTLSKEAIDKLNKVPRMERSRFVDKAILYYLLEGGVFTQEQIEYLNKYYIRKDDVKC